MKMQFNVFLHQLHGLSMVSSIFSSLIFFYFFYLQKTSKLHHIHQHFLLLLGFVYYEGKSAQSFGFVFLGTELVPGGMFSFLLELK